MILIDLSEENKVTPIHSCLLLQAVTANQSATAADDVERMDGWIRYGYKLEEKDRG